jgi:hypothetical protein
MKKPRVRILAIPALALMAVFGLAVGASPQSAMASTATAASTASSAHAHGMTAGIVHGAIPAGISFIACNSGTGSWMHIYFFDPQVDHNETACVGGKGTFTIDDIVDPQYGIQAFCPGNNNGDFYMESPQGNFYFGWVVGQGVSTLPSNTTLYSVTLTGWTGNATCPNSI